MPKQGEVTNKPVCPKCGSGQVRYRADKTFLCQRCGHDSRKEVS